MLHVNWPRLWRELEMKHCRSLLQSCLQYIIFSRTLLNAHRTINMSRHANYCHPHTPNSFIQLHPHLSVLKIQYKNVNSMYVVLFVVDNIIYLWNWIFVKLKHVTRVTRVGQNINGLWFLIIKLDAQSVSEYFCQSLK